jgi:hypothetical protein
MEDKERALVRLGMKGVGAIEIEMATVLTGDFSRRVMALGSHGLFCGKRPDVPHEQSRGLHVAT